MNYVPAYKFSYNGPCKKDCNIQVCEKIYKPICAEKPDGEQLTFSNLCDFENRNCYEFRNGIQSNLRQFVPLIIRTILNFSIQFS